MQSRPESLLQLTFKVHPSSFQPGAQVGAETLNEPCGEGRSDNAGRRLAVHDPAGAIAYLAVEGPDAPWPTLPGGKGTAGPLYLVWKNAELSKIGQEQWPYQLRSFTVKSSIEQRFSAILPAGDLGPDHPARAGYQAFVKHCFACHKLNGEGNSRLGPDLNEPYSPTEYMHEEYFRKLVRNPQSVRVWNESRMSSFSEAALPSSELDNIIAYLKHKAEQRRATGQK